MRRNATPAVPVLLVLVTLVMGGCQAGPAPDRQLLTEPERTAIADTLRRISREASQTFDSDLDCAEIADRLPISEGFVGFVAQGQLMELGGREDMVAMCRAVKQDRLSAHEEIEEQVVEVLSRDAAFVVTRGVYTVNFTDGRTSSRSQVVTTVWARGTEGWRMVHLHESWPR